MALPEFVTPVVAVVGTPALAYVAARSLWHAVRAVVVLVVSVVALKTDDENRRKACIDVLDKITGKGDPPWPPGRGRSGP